MPPYGATAADTDLPPQHGEIAFCDAADLLGISGKKLRLLIAKGVFHPTMRSIACNVHRAFLPWEEVRAYAERDRLRTPLVPPDERAALRRSLEEQQS